MKFNWENEEKKTEALTAEQKRQMIEKIKKAENEMNNKNINI
jgi:hypothetical protein